MLTDKDKLLSLAEVAKRWDVHKETVRARRLTGLRGIKFGRRLMFRLSDVRAYENARLDKPRL
jgi:Helix-turn-helix domain